VWALQTIFYKDPFGSKTKSVVRFVSSFILLIAFCSIIEYYFDLNSGGFLGKIVFVNLSNNLGSIGALIFLILFLIPASSLSFNFSWLKTIDMLGRIVINSLNYLFDFIKKTYSNLVLKISNSYKRYKDIRDVKKAEKEETKLLKSKIVSKDKKSTIKEESNKTSTIPQQPDLPNTSEPVIKEVESKEPIQELQSEKAVMPSTALLDRALDDGSSLTEEELSQIAALLETTLESVLPGPVVTRF